jgi:hypothetical protein
MRDSATAISISSCLWELMVVTGFIVQGKKGLPVLKVISFIFLTIHNSIFVVADLSVLNYTIITTASSRCKFVGSKEASHNERIKYPTAHFDMYGSNGPFDRRKVDKRPLINQHKRRIYAKHEDA